MGCDIHMMAEKRAKDGWKKVGSVFKNPDYKPGSDRSWEQTEFTDEPYDGRNYKLFSFLANVRNGYGFAGVDTGDEIKPIAMPKGVPSDASPEWLKEVNDWDVDMHSTSYFTVSELLNADWEQPIVARGVVNLEEYKRLKESGESPTSWSGGIDGPSIITATADDYESGNIENPTHIQMQWSLPIKDFAGSFYTDTLLQLEALGNPDEVRIVFGFDN